MPEGELPQGRQHRLAQLLEPAVTEQAVVLLLLHGLAEHIVGVPAGAEQRLVAVIRTVAAASTR